MDNSEKLSLFRTGQTDSVGLTDVKLPDAQLQVTGKLTLNKQTIAKLNNWGVGVINLAMSPSGTQGLCDNSKVIAGCVGSKEVNCVSHTEPQSCRWCEK